MPLKILLDYLSGNLALVNIPSGVAPTNSFLLLEDGFSLLLEDGFKLVLE